MSDVPRQYLPNRRRCITQKVKVGGQTVHYSIGLYEDGTPGELFIEVAKAGAALRQWAGNAAMMLSVALQHGTPLDVALDLFIGTRCDPCGEVVGHPCITRGLSIMDVIARDIAITFLNRNDLADAINTAPLLIRSVNSTHDPVENLRHGRRKDLDGGRRQGVVGDGETGRQALGGGEENGEGEDGRDESIGGAAEEGRSVPPPTAQGWRTSDLG